MDVTEDGRVRVSREEHSEKAFLLMTVRPSESVMDLRESQPEKASIPIDVKPSGRVTDWSEMQS